MKHDIVQRKDEIDLDKSLKKNKWKWSWLEKEVKGEGEETELVGKYIRKLKEDGKAYCEACNSDNIKYGGRGWNSLESHIKSKNHQEAKESYKNNYELPGSSKTTIYGVHPFFQHAKVKEVAENVTYTSVKDRTASAEATILSFCAENALSLSMAPRLANLTKTLAQDAKALNGIKLSRQAAAYKMINGVGKTFSERLYTELQVSHFSLNFDEATSKNLRKVVTILVSFYSESEKKVVVAHLSSIDVLKANANTIFNKI